MNILRAVYSNQLTVCMASPACSYMDMHMFMHMFMHMCMSCNY